MSVDTTVVIAALLEEGERRYTASIVQAADDLFGEDEHAFKKAVLIFLNQGYGGRFNYPWFSSLSRAKQFAALLADDEREQGMLEYENRPIIEIDLDNECVYQLSRKGNRVPARCLRHERRRARDACLSVTGFHSVQEGPGFRSERGGHSVTRSWSDRGMRH